MWNYEMVVERHFFYVAILRSTESSGVHAGLISDTNHVPTSYMPRRIEHANN